MVHIDADANHGMIYPRTFRTHFGEDSRKLLVIEQEIVRPANVSLQTGDLLDRILHRNTCNQRQPQRVTGRERWIQKERAIDPSPTFRMPGMSLAAAARRLLIGKEDRSLRAAFGVAARAHGSLRRQRIGGFGLRIMMDIA